MDTFVDERDQKLLEADQYTFAVLRRIMGAETQILLSDHENVIICFTGHPYPVWIWMPDSATAEEMERVYMLAKDKGLLNGDYHFNIKYDLAEYFMRRSAEDGQKMHISMNLFAYDCPDPIRPAEKAEGALHRCTMDDLDDLVDIIELFHQETEIDQLNREQYMEGAKGILQGENMYFWKDAEGRTVASCKFAPSGKLASINLVFTYPDHRRKHYAENLVYEVTKIARDEGYIPMLYTDADYVASNSCYEKIGYILRGKLCTIEPDR
ncbi:MAG: GNAT family N-acetyltransferase [Clostridiales bacterium]|nr:GNAT family N-acetyltransferase [Clostridiales bacterium]